MKVCSRHFNEDDYQIFLPGCKRLKKSAVPSVYLPFKVDAFSQTGDCDGEKNACSPRKVFSSFVVECEPHIKPTPDPPVFLEESFLEVPIIEEPDLTPSMQQAACGNDGLLHSNQAASNVVFLNEPEFYYLSGVSKSCFQSLFVMLTGESLTLPSCNISAQDQLLLTLCKYKHNFPYHFLKVIFKISETDASAVFLFWTHILFETLNLHFVKDVKPETDMQQSISVGIMKVPVSEPSSLCAQHSEHSKMGGFSYLKSLVVVDNDDESILYCSKLYGALTSDESMLLDKACQQCLARSTSIKVYGDLNLSILFPDKDIQVFLPDNATPCLCGSRGESMSCAFSSFMLTKQFQTLMEFYKILSEGLTPSVLILSSKIVFNCMMILNFRKR